MTRHSSWQELCESDAPCPARQGPRSRWYDRRVNVRPLTFAALTVALSACTFDPTAAEGVEIECTSDAQCLPSQHCVAARCHALDTEVPSLRSEVVTIDEDTERVIPLTVVGIDPEDAHDYSASRLEATSSERSKLVQTVWTSSLSSRCSISAITFFAVVTSVISTVV